MKTQHPGDRQEATGRRRASCDPAGRSRPHPGQIPLMLRGTRRSSAGGGRSMLLASLLHSSRLPCSRFAMPQALHDDCRVSWGDDSETGCLTRGIVGRSGRVASMSASTARLSSSACSRIRKDEFTAAVRNGECSNDGLGRIGGPAKHEVAVKRRGGLMGRR